MSKVVELLEGFVPAIASAVLVNGSAHTVEGRAHTARHISLDATAVSFKLVDHDPRDQEFQTLFFDELTTRGDEWLAVDGLREIKPNARVGEQPEHPARILRPSVPYTHRRPGHIGGTSPRDLLGSDENRRDLTCRSDDILVPSAKVSDLPALDPSYCQYLWIKIF